MISSSALNSTAAGRRSSRSWAHLPYGIVLFTIAVPIPIIRSLPVPLQQGWSIAVLIAIVASALMLRLRKPAFGGVWLWAGLFAGFAAITSSGQAGLPANLAATIPLVLVWAIAPFVSTWIVAERRSAVLGAIVGFVCMQTISALVAIAQASGIAVFGYSATLGRSPGLATHPNLLGVMGGVAVVVIIDRIFSARRWTTPSLGLLVINALGVVVSGSISAMISTLLGLVVVFAARRVSVLKTAAVAISAAIVTTLVLAYLPSGGEFRDPVRRLQQVTGQTGEQSTLFGRIDLMELAWQRIAANPVLGDGMTDAYAGVSEVGTYVHNFPLRAWMQGGIFLGIAAVMILIVAAIAIVRSVARADGASASAVITVLFGFSLTSTFFDSLYYWGPVVLAWGALSASSQFQPKGLTPRGDRPAS